MASSRRGLFLFAAAVLILGGGTFLSYYVDALWFESLGFGDVFWRTLNLQSLIFGVCFAATFAALAAAFLLLKPARLGDLAAGLRVNGRPVDVPIEPAFRLIAVSISGLIALLTALGMTADWQTFALYGHSGGIASPIVDPVFGKPLTFYLFTLPVWTRLSGWLTTVAVITCAIAVLVTMVRGGSRLARHQHGPPALHGLSVAAALLLVALAAQVFLSRYETLLDDHTVFAGVTYVDDHIVIPGLLVVAVALLAGAAVALAGAVAGPSPRWLMAAFVPAAVVYGGVTVLSGYVSSFIVRPNELVRERPYIASNIEMTRAAFALTSIEQVPFPADTGIAALEPDQNRATLDNIRLWDWRALQDTLRQIQEIRTYYDFPDIDIDRYVVRGELRQMMLAARELNVERLPESSRNWINERLIYTHGYGITMNPVNAFTPEGMPALVLGNMPVQSTEPELALTRPEIYFGELTNTDVYVRTRQQEFNFPEGDTNNLTTYEGTGGIRIGGLFRRLLLSLDRGDITRMPFSDDITSDSVLLMRRNIRDRVETLAPFLLFDDDPYLVVTKDGRLVWMLDGFTSSDNYPNARHYRLGRTRLNYLRNSIKATVDAYNGTVAFYVFDDADPIIAAYRSLFPSLFTDAAAMPADLRAHTRYPELLLQMQAAVYGLYHMTSPDVFYNREDLWTVASEGGASDRREAAQPMEPNFVLMTLPGERGVEFVEILPFTPANRNNLIGWIAGRSDGAQYGNAIVYNFPKTKLVDGPLQIEARVDQNADLAAQLALWNQQGSHVRRGSLIVIPVGRALLYVEPIYLQAERSPMPELRIVVLAMQDRLAYGTNFESALAALFGQAPSRLALTGATAATSAPRPAAPAPAAAGAAPAAGTIDAAIADAARDLAEYQRLTAEGRLGEAGQRLEALKQKLDALQRH